MSLSQDLSGNYYSESGYWFKIDKDTFRLITSSPAVEGRYSEIIAEGIIKRIDKSFIELNTANRPFDKFINTVKVSQEQKELSTDSTQVQFSMPYQGKLEIEIFCEYNGRVKFIYSNLNKRQIVNIPPKTESIGFTIRPEYAWEDSDGLCYGIIIFNSMIDIPIKKDTNFMSIEIPAIDDSFFQTYYVVGEYARIIDDTIIWKGVTYKKKND